MVKPDGIGDDHRHRDHGDQRQRHVHAQHENQAEHQQNQNPDQVGQLFGHKIPGGFNIAGAALNNVPRVIFHMPLEGEALDMRIQ